MTSLKPLFVDLDGTLIKEDLSQKAFLNFLKKKPMLCLYYLFICLFLGRPYLKEKISKNFTVDLLTLKKNNKCIEFIKEAKNHNRMIYLISGSHQLLVNQVSNQISLFNGVFGTHKNFNMIGKNKIEYINKELKIFDFDYIGNSKQDLPIWEYTKKIIFTNASPKLKKKIEKLNFEILEIKESFKT